MTIASNAAILFLLGRQRPQGAAHPAGKHAPIRQAQCSPCGATVERQRFVVRHVAWQRLSHAWEIEDRPV